MICMMQWIGDGTIAECMKGGLQGVIRACMLVAKFSMYMKGKFVTNIIGAPRALYLSLVVLVPPIWMHVTMRDDHAHEP